MEEAIDEALDEAETVRTRVGKRFNRKKNPIQQRIYQRTDQQRRRGNKMQTEVMDSNGVYKMTCLGPFPVHKNERLLEIVEECKKLKEDELAHLIINFAKAHSKDVRYYKAVYHVDIENPKINGRSTDDEITDENAETNELGEEADAILKRIMDDIEARILGEENCDLREDVRPKLFRRLPCHRLEEGDLYLDEISIIWHGTETQHFHQDVSVDLDKVPQVVKGLMEQPSSLPKNQLEKVKIKDMKECIGPCSFEYLLEEGEKSPIMVQQEDGQHSTRTINYGQAFLFSGYTTHAGAKHAPKNRFRLHGHVDVKGLGRQKGSVDLIVSDGMDDEVKQEGKKGPSKRTPRGGWKVGSSPLKRARKGKPSDS